MKHHRAPSPIGSSPVPAVLIPWLQPFREFFSAPVWDRVLVLVAGVVLAPGKRTVTSALRIMGLDTISNFTGYHQVLNRARWNPRKIGHRLLRLILDRLVPDGPVVIGIDDTIERRWGPMIAARGIYRDPVRSSKDQFVKTSGLRWLSLMVLTPVPWAARTMWATSLFDADSRPREAAWYAKTSLTFSDAIAAVRHSLWLSEYFVASDQGANPQKFPNDLTKRMAGALCYAA